MQFVNFNDKEESTCLLSLTMLQISYVKIFLWFPLASIFTLMILPIRMYWYPEVRARHFYWKTDNIDKCTAILVNGRDGNSEIVSMVNYNEKVRPLLPQVQ